MEGILRSDVEEDCGGFFEEFGFSGSGVVQMRERRGRLQRCLLMGGRW